MPPYAVTLDITGHVPGLSGSLLMSTWIFAPCDQATKGVIFCPGSKAYYHLVVPGIPEDTYSFGLYMAQRGWLVIAIDSLGTGESTQLEEILTRETLACANEVAFQHLLARVLEGDFDFSLPRINYPSLTICIGHGKGALLAMTQHARYRTFDALALSGWSNSQFSLGGCEEALTHAIGRKEVFIGQAAREAIPDATYRVLQPFLFSVGVPSSVVSAYVPHIPDFIRGLTQYDYGLVQKIAVLLDVPIFLCLAGNDVSDNLRAEAATYPWSPEVTTFHLLGSAHLHNFATTRHLLWAQVEAWVQRVQDRLLARR